MVTAMKRILVWDLPTRLFHLLLACSFAGTFGIAELVDDDSATFVVHMLLGGVMAFMVVLRILWGLFGSRWARFGSFAFGPGAVLEYLRGVIRGSGKHHVGHNPGSSVAIFAMLGLTLGLAITGANMATGGDVMEELHEVFAFALLATVGLHVAGVVLHSLRHRENLTLSMIDGHKQGEPSEAIASAHPLAALLFLGLVGAWALGLVTGYDPATRQVTLPVLGTTLQLGEGEGGEGDAHGDKGHHDEDHDD
jgi:cytochrome b